MEPITTTTVVTVFGPWAAKKLADGFWIKLSRYFRPDQLQKQIAEHLAADAAFSKYYTSTPRLDKGRLTPERILRLLQATVTNDIAALARYIADEQLVDLPIQSKERPSSFDEIWLAVARAIAAATEIAIVEDEELFREFHLAATQRSFAGQASVITELQSLKAQVENLAANLSNPPTNDAASITIESRRTEGLSENAATRTVNLLANQVDGLEQQLREQLDANTERIWEKILSEIEHHNFRGAIDRTAELQSWLEKQGQQISPGIRGRAWLLLAQVALIQSAELEPVGDDFTKARALFERARDEFGPTPSDENLGRLSNFQAKLFALEGKDEEGLGLLASRTDNQSITTRLLILIDNGRFEAAAHEIRQIPLDLKWCDHAVLVFARIAAIAEAQATLDWVGGQEEPTVDTRSRVAYARGTLLRLSAAHENEAFSAIAIEESEIAEVRKVFSILQPIADACQARGQIRDGLEAEAIAFTYSCCRLLGRVEEASLYARVLQNFRPLSLDYLVAAFRQDVDPPTDLVAIAREDHPYRFEAQFLAVAIEIRAGLEASQVLERVVALEELAVDNQDREKLGRVALQAALSRPAAIQQTARDFIMRILGESHFLVRLLDLDQFLACGQFEQCEKVLAEIECPTDILVEQFRAQVLIKRKHFGGASKILEAVGRRMSEPDLLIDAARLALDARPRHLDVALNALADAVQLCPNDPEAIRMLAYVHVQLKGYLHAAKYLEKLSSLEPEDFNHKLKRAQCLALANRASDSLTVLDELCAASPIVLGAHLARAKLLTNQGRPQRAFASLHEIRDEFWASPEYVAMYMSIAHSANQERRAHEGFQQLWNLRNEGIAPEDVLQPKTFDDFVKFGEAAREQSRLLQDQMLEGKIPWLLVEQLLNNVPYWGWRVRTQSLAWLMDSPYERASFAIYATNSYAVLSSEDGQSSLQRVSAAERGQAVVVDLSALITLHRLDLLSAALEYFGAIKIPPSYLADVLRHAGKLLPHQLSRKHVLEQIRQAIDRGLVTIFVSEASASKRVDEYVDEPEVAYRLRNVLDTLSRAGKLSSQQLEAALQVAHKEPLGNDDGAALAPTDTILVDLLTLQTVTGVKLLDMVCETFSCVAISSEDRRRLDQELRDFALGSETHSWHEDLWRTLGEDSRVDATRSVFHVAESDVEHDDQDSDEVTVLDAALLALQENMPLLVDDRVCQNMVLRMHGTSPRAAFGTDCLISRLREAGLIDEPRACRALLSLIEWRYRFLLLSEEELRIIAQHGAPADLRKVARYVHDCMRDPGLFAGPEATTPPIPLAYRFYQDWLHTIAHFVADLWQNESFSEERAIEVTRWAMSELVPTIPRGLGAAIGRIADFSAFTVLHFAMLRLCRSADSTRANAGLRTMATALGLSDQLFIQLAADVINSHDD
ncbi:tetratricopeptide repeat protein [Lignipirellula cremea]|uniref:Uncharacterized protein n=1 Tax=Lignipirellula cremea TaxID=2528010 RepID=A0A518DRP6_9BACT|nr:hypothetical protein [Lignipirellula cremea]QDU94484.1 hypothetical protein Pla8534_22750 [Lignipirellula cremea]